MRRGAALVLMAAAMLCWIASMIVQPQTSWGVEHEQVRPYVAAMIARFAGGCLALLAAAAPLMFWEAEHRRGRMAVAFGILLVALTGTAAARLLWIEFVVLT